MAILLRTLRHLLLLLLPPSFIVSKIVPHHDELTASLYNLTNVVVMFRHGDRTPVDPYPNDPYKDPKYWPVDFGQLTPKGKMMQFQLGKYLRKRYEDFLSPLYSEKDIYVRSTDMDRTLMSAYSNLAGLYPPMDGQVWNANLSWQPIPVHTMPLSEDNLLSNHAECPKLTALLDELMKSPEIVAIDAKYSWLYDYLSKNTGATINDLVQVGYIFDTLYIQTLYNLTLPDWTKAVFPDKMLYPRDLSFKLSTWTHDLKRLRAGPLIQWMVEYFSVVANGSDIQPKFIMYSGHDTSVASFLDALSMFDPPKAPPYASMVIMEMFRRNNDQEPVIRFSYRNDSSQEPYVLHLLDQCPEFCPLEQVKLLTRSLIPDNWTQECFSVTTNSSRRIMSEYEDDSLVLAVTQFSVGVSVLLSLLLVVAVMVSCCRKNPLSGNGYQYRTIYDQAS